jgi:tetratricopeptide (TPR) repeat protein
VAIVRNAAGDYDEAETRLRQLLENPATNRSTRDGADSRLSHLLLMRGKLAEADRRVEAAAVRSGNPSQVALQVGRHRFDVTSFVRRDSVAARAMLRQGLTLIGDSPDTTTSRQVAAACALVGELTCARSYLRRAGDDGPPQPWTNFDAYLAHAWIAVAERNYPDAIRLFRGYADRRCPRCEESFVGYVFERMQQPDSAIAAYERYLSAPSVDRIFADAYDLGFVLERLGALYEQRNDRANAAKHYARFVSIWKNADAELQPRVAEAHRRLQLLRPDR